MSKALENLKQHFQNELNGEEGTLQKIDFPEIGVPCFAREALTAYRKGKILNALKNEGQLAFCVEVVINCLLDENSAYIFQSGNKHDLLREGSSRALERVSGEICKVVFGDDDVEEALMRDDLSKEESVALKNSKPTKSC
jgi:hypothetical protein